MNMQHIARFYARIPVLKTVIGLVLLGLLSACSLSGLSHRVSPSNDETIPVIVAADRGFLGNEMLREAAQQAGISKEHIVIVHSRNFEAKIKEKLQPLALRQQKVLVLPYFMSAQEPLFKKVSAQLNSQFCGQKNCEQLLLAPVLGQSYLLRESLFQKLQRIDKKTPVILLVTGAKSTKDKGLIEKDVEANLQPVFVESGHKLEAIYVWQDGYAQFESQLAQLKALASEKKAIILAFHLGRKLDGMMGLNAYLKRSLGPQLEADEPLTIDLATTWLKWQLNRYTPVCKDNLGVVLLAHGSDIDWNDTMRQAAQPVVDSYDTEFVFSMADKQTIERAIRKLEARGKKHAVIVRIFGQSSSFARDIERMFGQDTSPVSGHGHHHHANSQSPRIVTSLNVVSVGGLDDHDLFASALYDRARELSSMPQKEVLILAAHGKGDDKENDKWQQNLKRILQKVKRLGADQFARVEYVTWREDWEDKKGEALNKVESIFSWAEENGHDVLIVPARTTGQGPARHFLKGKNFKLGTGFAPHPSFAKWLQEQINKGLSLLGAPIVAGTSRN